jgi:hypothetical protein
VNKSYSALVYDYAIIKLMAIDEQKKYSGLSKFEQEKTFNKHAEVEKLRAEIADMRKQLAEKKVEIKPEFFVESAQEGAKSAEQTEAASIGQPITAGAASQSPQTLITDEQVKTLCDLAFQKGVEAALKAAQELNNPYVLDEFHDALVDQLYDRLISEKKIELE